MRHQPLLRLRILTWFLLMGALAWSLLLALQTRQPQ